MAKNRFNKAQLVKDLRERAEHLRHMQGFTTMTGTAQLKVGGRTDSERTRNLDRSVYYGQWQELLTLAGMIEDGQLGVDP